MPRGNFLKWTSIVTAFTYYALCVHVCARMLLEARTDVGCPGVTPGPPV